MTPTTPRGWYLIGAGLIISSVTMGIVAFGQMLNTVEGMQRVLMPGRADITLPGGTSTLYAEQRSIYDNKSYEVSATFPFRCGIDEQQRKVTFTKATGQISYSIGDYAGHNAWDVDVPEAGTYALVCEGDQQFVMAVGRGVGSWIVVAAVGLVPFLIGVAIVVLIFVKRRRQLRATA